MDIVDITHLLGNDLCGYILVFVPRNDYKLIALISKLFHALIQSPQLYLNYVLEIKDNPSSVNTNQPYFQVTEDKGEKVIATNVESFSIYGQRFSLISHASINSYSLNSTHISKYNKIFNNIQYLEFWKGNTTIISFIPKLKLLTMRIDPQKQKKK
eukprot:529816_1